LREGGEGEGAGMVKGHCRGEVAGKVKGARRTRR